MAVATETAQTAGKESFAALLDESLGTATGLEGTVVKGTVLTVENDMVLIDVGLFHLLVHRRGWAVERFQTWLAGAIERELLG